MKSLLFTILLIIYVSFIYGQGSGKCLIFDGGNDLVSISAPSTHIGNSDFTVECFAYFDAGSLSSYRGVISAFDQTTGGWAIMQQDDGSLRFVIGLSSTGPTDVATSFGSISAGQWYHIAVVKSGTNIYFYLNGQLKNSSTSNRTIPYNDIHVGQRYISTTSYSHDGAIDEVRIWNAALSLSTIREWIGKKINNSHANYSDLVVYLNMDEGSGTTTYDQSSHSNDGTLTNGPAWSDSGVRLGDKSTYANNPTSGTSLTLSHPDGDEMGIGVSSGSADLLYLMYIDEEPNVTTPPTGMDQLSQEHYFEIVQYNGSIDLNINYDYDGHPGITDESQLGLAIRSHNGTASWTDAGASLNTSSKTLSLTGVSIAPGKQIILASTSDNTLPLNFVDFDVFARDDCVWLRWTTLNMVNFHYFLIERKNDFNSPQICIDTVRIEDYSSGYQTFEYKDYSKNPLSYSYYQIKAVDYDGTFIETQLKGVASNKSDFELTVTPNPVSETALLKISSPVSQRAELYAYDALGREVFRYDVVLKKGPNMIMRDFSNAALGVIYLRVKMGDVVVNKKIIKM